MTTPPQRQGAFILLAFMGTVPAIGTVFLQGPLNLHLNPAAASIVFGIGILSAAFLLSWAAEAAEHDISHGLALAIIAVITVLPEYAVDFTLVWKAGGEAAAGIPFEQREYVHYAVANMTGANRLLIGLAWPLVILLAWARTRTARVQLNRTQAIEIGFLGAATLYAFTIPLKRHIDLLDAVVLIGLFLGYMWLSSRAEVREPELVGPAALIGSLTKGWRRLTVVGILAFAATLIFLSAEPFAEGMIESGKGLGIDEFLLIQWVAPLASEAPEIVVASIFALRGDAASGLGLLISAKVNQWTLLVGSLPLVYSISSGAPAALPLDARQMEEVLLTAAQSNFAVVLLASLFLSPRGALVLLVLFTTQLVLPYPTIRLAFSGIYIGATVLLLLFDGRRRGDAFSLPKRALREAYLTGARVRRPEGLLEPEPRHQREEPD